MDIGDFSFAEARFVFRKNHSEGIASKGLSDSQNSQQDVLKKDKEKTAVGLEKISQDERSELADSFADSLFAEEDVEVVAAVREKGSEFSSFLENAQTKAIENSEFLDVDLEYHNGFALYQDKESGRWNFVGKAGEKLGPFDRAWDFNAGFAKVKNGKLYNFLNTKGEFLLEKDTHTADGFKDGIALVGSGNGYNFIDIDGKSLFEENFDYASAFENGLALVSKGGEYNFIDMRGNSLLAEGVDFASGFKDGLAKVEKNGAYNFVDMRGELLLESYVSNVDDFKDGIARVEANGEVYSVNTKGRRV